MLQTSGGMRALVFEVDIDIPELRDRQFEQVGVR